MSANSVMFLMLSIGQFVSIAFIYLATVYRPGFQVDRWNQLRR